MDADERRSDAVFLAEASFVVRGRYLVIAGNVIEGNLKKAIRSYLLILKALYQDAPFFLLKRGLESKAVDLLVYVLLRTLTQISNDSSRFNVKV